MTVHLAHQCIIRTTPKTVLVLPPGVFTDTCDHGYDLLLADCVHCWHRPSPERIMDSCPVCGGSRALQSHSRCLNQSENYR